MTVKEDDGFAFGPEVTPESRAAVRAAWAAMAKTISLDDSRAVMEAQTDPLAREYAGNWLAQRVAAKAAADAAFAAGEERSRQGRQARGLENRKENPGVELLGDAELSKSVGDTQSHAQRIHREKCVPLRAGRPRGDLSHAEECHAVARLYFSFRLELDYRQAQGC